MAYSNGFDLERVLPALTGRIGWKSDILSAANQESKSGRFFDDGSFHPLISQENIDATHSFTGDASAFFMQLQKSVIQKCLSGVFSQPEYREQTYLYEPEEEQTSVIANTGKFVGYRLEVAKQSDVTVQINSAVMYFTNAHTFNLYLFKEGKKAPLKTISVDVLAEEKTVIPLDDWRLNFSESGTYYIGYFQDDLGETTNAIREQVVSLLPLRSLAAYAIQAEATGAAEFKRTALAYTAQPSGLNLYISSFTDYTQAIINQPFLFDELIGQTMVFAVLEGMLHSTKSNGLERLIKDGLDRASLNIYLYGTAPISDGPQTKGLDKRLEAMHAQVRKSFYPKGKARAVNLVC